MSHKRDCHTKQTELHERIHLPSVCQENSQQGREGDVVVEAAELPFLHVFLNHFLRASVELTDGALHLAPHAFHLSGAILIKFGLAPPTIIMFMSESLSY